MKKSVLAVQLVLAVSVLALLPSPTRAADNYIEGLSIQLEDYPCEIQVGETFTMTVRVVNQSGQEIEGYLRTYLYGHTGVIAYPSADYRNTVLLNENWDTNGISINLGENENKLFTFSLTVRPDVQLVGDSALVKLRARISRSENDIYTSIAPSNNRYVTLLPKTLLPESSPEGIVVIKFGVGVAVAAAIVYSVVAIQKRNNKGARKRARK